MYKALALCKDLAHKEYAINRSEPFKQTCTAVTHWEGLSLETQNGE